MKKPVFMSGEEVARLIESSKTIATIGMTLVSSSETILKALENWFLETGTPRRYVYCPNLRNH